MGKLSDKKKGLDTLNSSKTLRLAASRLDCTTQAIQKWFKLHPEVQRDCRYVDVSMTIDATTAKD